jgi:hypothetical protein
VADDHVAHDVRALVLPVPVAHRRAVGVERLGVGRPLGVGDDRQRLVLDDDRLGGAARLLRVLRGDDRHRLAEVADAVDRQHRLVAELEPVALVAGNVVVREDGVDALERERRREVDRADARVCVRAAERVAPEHPRGGEVARVRELARHLRDPVDAADALADAAELELPRRGAHAPAPPGRSSSARPIARSSWSYARS